MCLFYFASSFFCVLLHLFVALVATMAVTVMLNSVVRLWQTKKTSHRLSRATFTFLHNFSSNQHRKSANSTKWQIHNHSLEFWEYKCNINIKKIYWQPKMKWHRALIQLFFTYECSQRSHITELKKKPLKDLQR